jgi:hypothetical protein
LHTPVSATAKAASADATKANQERGNIMQDTKKLTGLAPVHRDRAVAPPRARAGRAVHGWAKYVADQAGAYWLLDEIALAERYEKTVAGEEFQLWKLTVNADRTATLTCEDGNGKAVYRKAIEYTDFPLPEIALYFTNSVILLPSEY